MYWEQDPRAGQAFQTNHATKTLFQTSVAENGSDTRLDDPSVPIVKNGLLPAPILAKYWSMIGVKFLISLDFQS